MLLLSVIGLSVRPPSRRTKGPALPRGCDAGILATSFPFKSGPVRPGRECPMRCNLRASSPVAEGVPI